jgi:hypothetical protein
MTVLYVLDTDHLTLLQRNHRAVITRFTALPPEVIAATIVSAMEQVRGRLAQIHRAKTASEVVRIGISNDAWDRSCSQAKNLTNARRCRVMWSRIVPRNMG